MGPGWPGIVASDGTARGGTEERILAAIASGRPDLEVRYLFGGFVVVPRGTPVIAAATLETLWEKVMEGAPQGGTVAGEVVCAELATVPSVTARGRKRTSPGQVRREPQAAASRKNGADVTPGLGIGTPAAAAHGAENN
jgi:hypothetical protein